MLYLPFVSNREPVRTDAEGEHLDEPQGLKESAHGGDAIGRAKPTPRRHWTAFWGERLA
jgi:hypothetical protein